MCKAGVGTSIIDGTIEDAKLKRERAGIAVFDHIQFRLSDGFLIIGSSTSPGSYCARRPTGVPLLGTMQNAHRSDAAADVDAARSEM